MAHHESVMVCLLPTTTDWCKTDLAHSTVVYCGEIPDLAPGVQDQLKGAAAALSMTVSPITTNVTGVDIFGKEKDTEVMKLAIVPNLIFLYRRLHHWNASEFNYSPHVTCGGIGSAPKDIPTELTFDRLAVCWGPDRTVYRLR